MVVLHPYLCPLTYPPSHIFPLLAKQKNASRKILGVKNVHIMHNEMDF